MKIWDKKKGKYREGKILTMYEDYEQLINNLEQLVSRFDILEVGGGRGRKSKEARQRSGIYWYGI